MIATWVYQTAIFSLIGHRLFASPGQLRVELFLTAVFLGTFVLLIDSYMIMRSGWHTAGIQELKRGGIDLGGGIGARLKMGFFLSIRLALSVGIAELSAIFLCLYIFGTDIDRYIHNRDAQLNAALIQATTARIDGDAQRSTEAVAGQTARVAAWATQLQALRQQAIDNSDPLIQQAQREVDQFVARKDKADEDIRTAETFASNELGGIKGAAGNSGQPGNGVRYKAAIEQVTNARARAQGIAKDLSAARGRLDDLRKKIPPPSDAARQRFDEQLSAFEKALDAENAKLARLKEELASLTTGRENSIRKAVANAPDHVQVDGGLIAQISVLDQIAQESTKITLVTLLIGVVSFGFELAAVLAKVTSYVPTTYAALLARDAYMRVVKVVDDMAAELNATDRQRPQQPGPPPRDKSFADEHGIGLGPDLFANSNDPVPTPPKRRRGRPRKYPLPTEPSKVAEGEQIKNGHQAE
jgi:predicted  nucleic acid-binding Zn-ribbon protein